MDEKRARKLLSDKVVEDDCLFDESVESHVLWQPTGDPTARLDGHFTADELEAISWWMRNKRKQKSRARKAKPDDQI